MADIETVTWSETAASNNAVPPGGWPEGQAPSTVNDCAREMMGALKRDWDRSHTTIVSGGTASALTLTYITAPSSYINGQRFSFRAAVSPAAGATANVNALGAKTIQAMTTLGLANLIGNEWQPAHHVTLEYDSTADVLVVVSVTPQSVAGGNFAPTQQSSPNMTVRIGAGTIILNGVITAVGAQNTATFTAPVSQPRNDIIYIGATTGTVGVVSGTPAPSPVDPVLPVNVFAIARVRLQTTTTSITNALIDDLRLIYQEASIYNPPSLGTGFLYGCNLSNDGGSPNTVLDIAAGSARDATDADNLVLSSAFTKTTGAWAVGSGNGGLDTGSVGANANYNVWLIKRTDTGVVDVLFSLSGTAPTMPGSYTEKRRIGGFLTDASNNIIPGTWKGNGVVRDFDISTPLTTTGFDDVNPGTAAVLKTMRCPAGNKHKLHINVGIFSTSGSDPGGYISDPDNADMAPLASGAASSSPPGNSVTGPGSVNLWNWNKMDVWTNTSSQIRYRISVSSATQRIAAYTLGWTEYL